LVEPKLVGDQTGIHPLWILFAFYVGVQLFGPFGFLIGPISAVMVRATGRMLIAMDWVG
jgi:predicted PurR-regulated permease PerM